MTAPPLVALLLAAAVMATLTALPAASYAQGRRDPEAEHEQVEAAGRRFRGGPSLRTGTIGRRRYSFADDVCRALPPHFPSSQAAARPPTQDAARAK